MRKSATLALLNLAALACAIMGIFSTADAQEISAPQEPLAHASGAVVTLAWRLPAAPRPLTVVIFRRVPGGQFSQLASVEAHTLGYGDANVTLGMTYEYAIRLEQRGVPLSAISEPASATVGASDRVVFRGGSATRAIFDVTLFVQGRKHTETFVHGAGEEIGDLRRVEGEPDPLDFRMGTKIASLRLETAPGKSVSSEVLLDAKGQPLLDLAGKPVTLSFPAAGETRERLVVELTTREGKQVTLTEGEGLSP